MRIVLTYFAFKYDGDWNAIYKALENKERISIVELNQTEAFIKKLEDEGVIVKTLLDFDYPALFKHAYKPPFVIFAKGDYDLLKNLEKKPTHAFIGSKPRKTDAQYIKARVDQLDDLGSTFIELESSMATEIAFSNTSTKTISLGNGSNFNKDFWKASLRPSKLMITESLHNRFDPQKTIEFKEPIVYKEKKSATAERLVAALAKKIYVFPSEEADEIEHWGPEKDNLTIHRIVNSGVHGDLILGHEKATSNKIRDWPLEIEPIKELERSR